MIFIDEAEIKVVAGNGGKGVASFCRERSRPFGGPDGGDGGSGGSIWAIADCNINTLIDYRYSKLQKASNGKNGHGAGCYGKGAPDIYLRMPLGTQIIDKNTGERVADLTEHTQIILLAKGGKGGLGNIHFKTSTNRAPRQKTDGKIGECREFYLELKVIADVGLLGAPNAGKSTLIAAISNARPKIANYVFTTLHPNLGVVRVDYGKSFIVADIPGLIKGAARGVGLGIKFLRHLQRTNLLLHVIDLFSFENIFDIAKEAQAIIQELKIYDITLFNKPRWLVLNKLDIVLDSYNSRKRIEDFIKYLDWQGPVFEISALTHLGCKHLITEIYKYLNTKNKYQYSDIKIKGNENI